MTSNEGSAARARRGKEAPHRVRLPGFTAGTEIGVGDAIKRATSLAGIRPCTSCRERAARLNGWMVLSGRR
jgi:hypothetical protein